MSQKAIIIGAGPAGLTAAYELLKRTDIKPIILEKSGDIGGISKTINYKGNRMDIGGHRFFSKSDRVMNWWLNIMPLDKTTGETVTINYQHKTHSIYTNTNQGTGEHENPGLVMLVRKRLSRIYFLRKFFNYPIQLSLDTLRKLGFVRTIRILHSYLAAQLMPRKPEKSLEDFLINRFGRQLYGLFFKDYTEKVWGVPCNEISAEWGAQRIKGVSISKAIRHAAQTMVKSRKGKGDISQKDTETSLIEQFLYPALGPGQLWEEVARKIEVLGGTILMHQDVKEINITDGKVTGVMVVNSQTGETTEHEGDYFFSTMPVQELIGGMNGSVPANVKEVAAGLQYRDFITVGVLLEQLSTTESKTGEHKPLDLKDTWIYIQEKDVKVGRLQLFNNWSPYMVNKPGSVWIGMEYFCNKGDDFWELSDDEIKRSAISELEKMGLAQVSDVLDSTVHRVEKTYPAYFGTYNQFDKIRAYVDQFENLFLVGRNGMHKYNNSDHSMLTAMTAVDNICEGVRSKENVWAINTEQEYHEEQASSSAEKAPVRELQPTPAAEPQALFSHFVFREQKKLLRTAIGLCVLQFVIFKLLYPHANFMTDSYLYLDGAIRKLDINIWPIGYSWFLRLVGSFSHSDFVLVSIQYIILQGGLLYLLFTILYFLKPGRVVTNILLIFYCINPMLLSISNYVLSDGIFTGLSLIWFTQLLWITFKPNKKLIILNGLLLFVLFTIRYNALYYPFLTAIVLFSSKANWRIKLVSQGIPILLIGAFIWRTSTHYKELTGTRTFSPFSGWMLANDAMIMYSHMPMQGENKEVPQQFQRLHQIVTTHLDSLNQLYFRPDTLIQLYYMWLKPSPLKQYMNETYPGNEKDYFKYWSTIGPLFGEYGRWLIQKHPVEFAKYYLLQNAIWYTAPPPEGLGIYNLKKDSVFKDAVTWFQYKSPIKKGYANEMEIIKLYTFIIGGINGIALFMFIGLLLFDLRKRADKYLKKIITLMFITWLISTGFSIVSAPVVMRYELFPILILLPFACIVFEQLIKEGRRLSKEEKALISGITKPSIS